MRFTYCIQFQYLLIVLCFDKKIGKLPLDKKIVYIVQVLSFADPCPTRPYLVVLHMYYATDSLIYLHIESVGSQCIIWKKLYCFYIRIFEFITFNSEFQPSGFFKSVIKLAESKHQLDLFYKTLILLLISISGIDLMF